MKEYTFGVATGALYDFFLYELCDYYLELLKPLMSGEAAAAVDAGGDVATAQRLARTTLHVCLELGLRMLHPMMPFVTEELWQRLPGRGKPLRAGPGAPADWSSVMVAQYPSTPLPGITRPDIEADFTLYQAALRAGRALRADAEIVPSKYATVFITARDESSRRALSAQHKDLMTLLRSDNLTIIDDESKAAEGCSVSVVNENVSVHLLLKGLIDPLAEVGKLDRKADKARKELEVMKRRLATPGYADKVPADVQAANLDVIAGLEKQLEVIAGLIVQYKSWAAAGSS
jgi:valyl-tRNA synthetase